MHGLHSYLGAVLICLAATLGMAHAGEAAAERDVLVEECTEVLKAGVDQIVLRVKLTNGSFGVPMLVGLRDQMPVWSVPLPNASEINTAKSFARCKGSRGRKGQVIDIASQNPAEKPWTVQRFRWSGQTIKRLGQWVRP
jgi:hypothetical protein